MTRAEPALVRAPAKHTTRSRFEEPLHMQTVSTCLWFDDRAQEAATFYVSLFRTRASSTLRTTSKARLARPAPS
jgi:hypothetical protein